MQIGMGPRGVLNRRHFLRNVTAGGLALGGLSFTDMVSLNASELKRRGMSCILLWMQGGPSQFETFDPKPGHANGGETKAIATNVPGTQISENLPHLARIADQLAIVRSLSTKEGEHQRASYMMHTSYIPTATVRYPTLGAVVAKELADQAASELPSFVRIGNVGIGAGNEGGLLGQKFNAYPIQDGNRPPENTRPTTEEDRYRRRLTLLDRLEEAAPGEAVARRADHESLYNQASRFVLSPSMSSFDISNEPESVRKAYGIGASSADAGRPAPNGLRIQQGQFAAGCLLARRLIESGVTFVEVAMGNWDTHQDNFDLSRRLCEQIDQPFAALVEDLRQRGRLDKTLVIWMGEFGRTPRINPRGGRDHHPQSFSAVLAGGGMQVGQVVGATDAGGERVVERPINEKDLFQTIYQTLGVNAKKEYMSAIGRPIAIVDGGSPVDELLG
ncbi:MAG: DUF1501 domain-containing protein [Planctomycetes bacterium]|nr:DUF1501 domain-containing protein [Planctomycetota bacterium]